MFTVGASGLEVSNSIFKKGVGSDPIMAGGGLSIRMWYTMFEGGDLDSGVTNLIGDGKNILV
jgi:hypothetical protein